MRRWAYALYPLHFLLLLLVRHHRLIPVGGGLPPIAVCQPAWVQADSPQSGASPLPHLRHANPVTPPAMRRWAYALYPVHFLLLLLLRQIIV